VARYHVVKATRIYEGSGYSGYSAQQVGAPQPVEEDSLEEAKKWLIRLEAFNPVGWNIYDSTTGECVVGLDHFG
jgi:hypothetical protein